jgi:hypothetical protein
LREIYARYQKALRKEKRQILTEFCTVARYNRNKYALRLLDGRLPKRVPPEKRKRRPKYSRGGGRQPPPKQIPLPDPVDKASKPGACREE